jgi:hypothetical protein
LGGFAGAPDDLAGYLCADIALLVPLKRSEQYVQIRTQVADPRPADTWQDEGLHYYVFELRSKNKSAKHSPVALFTMLPGEPVPVLALVIKRDAKTRKANVVDLKQPRKKHTVQLS